MNKLWFEDGAFINDANNIISEMRGRSSRYLASNYCLRITQVTDKLPGDVFIFGLKNTVMPNNCRGYVRCRNENNIEGIFYGNKFLERLKYKQTSLI
jgi:hypothetical protein